MTLEEAKQLRYRQVIHENFRYNAYGTCRRWRVNGKVKTWKRTPGRVLVPLKSGLHFYFHLQSHSLPYFHLPGSKGSGCENE